MKGFPIDQRKIIDMSWEGNKSAELASCSTLIDLLRYRAEQQADLTAYIFLKDGESEEASLTYSQLDRQARSIAAFLQAETEPGDRVLLLLPQSLFYLAAFFGCLYAGAIPIPVFPPRTNRSDPRIEGIVKDAKASLAITTSQTTSGLKDFTGKTPEFLTLKWVTSEDLAQDRSPKWKPPETKKNSIAYLQYTSGSTLAPRGVMVGHNNVLKNLDLLCGCRSVTSQSRWVSWLPLYHDMGLLGGALCSLYAGGMTALMSPVAFLQKPLRWLQAISQYKATHTAAPNFAYGLCVKNIPPEERKPLDLRSWETAWNAAEPIHHETLIRFQEAFGPCGFQWEAFAPGYGLAEATLIVSSQSIGIRPSFMHVDKSALQRDLIVEVLPESEHRTTVVGCGKTVQEVAIVDPVKRIPCSSDQVGEIWISGASVALGYWNRKEETEQTFHASLAESKDHNFLRTGDLGFIKNGELYITGRLKDLIIIRGSNHYPQDIEWTVEKSHSALKEAGSAAFSVEVESAEHLAVVAEVSRDLLRREPDLEEIFTAIRQAISEEHGLQVFAISLLQARSIPKTSSGKIQHAVCRSGFLNHTLSVLASWRLGDELPLKAPLLNAKEAE